MAHKHGIRVRRPGREDGVDHGMNKRWGSVRGGGPAAVDPKHPQACVARMVCTFLVLPTSYVAKTYTPHTHSKGRHYREANSDQQQHTQGKCGQHQHAPSQPWAGHR